MEYNITKLVNKNIQINGVIHNIKQINFVSYFIFVFRTFTDQINMIFNKV